MALDYKVVLIDDNKNFRSDMYALGNSVGFELFTYDNLNDGMEKIRDDARINGLVLDAECKISADDKESLNFLAQAAREVEALKTNRDRDIFVIVNTAFSDEVTRFFGESYPINRKEEHHKLFEALKEGIDTLEKTYVRRKHSDSIDRLNKIVGSSAKEEYLIRLLKNQKREDHGTIESNLEDARKVFEAVVRVVYGKCSVPTNMYEREKFKYLEGRKCFTKNGQQHETNNRIIPEYISNACFAIWGNGSAGGHDNDDEIHSTKFSVMGTTYLLLELINWISIWMDEN